VDGPAGQPVDGPDDERVAVDGFVAVDDESAGIHWRFERDFLTSHWTCIWGHGCAGIADVAAPALQLGCCSVGAELGDPEEAMNVSALATMIPPELWQHRDAVDGDDVFSDGSRTNTKVVDGACIFLNRPGFAGGAGCALHLAAIAAGEAPTDWKPSVCWQLPIRVDWAPLPDGTETATVRRWSRADWGAEGSTMAWCCTEEPAVPSELTPSAYIGAAQVVDSLDAELRALAGGAVVVELRRRLSS
jgi:hypothetical protein